MFLQVSVPGRSGTPPYTGVSSTIIISSPSPLLALDSLRHVADALSGNGEPTEGKFLPQASGTSPTERITVRAHSLVGLVGMVDWTRSSTHPVTFSSGHPSIALMHQCSSINAVYGAVGHAVSYSAPHEVAMVQGPTRTVRGPLETVTMNVENIVCMLHFVKASNSEAAEGPQSRIPRRPRRPNGRSGLTECRGRVKHQRSSIPPRTCVRALPLR